MIKSLDETTVRELSSPTLSDRAVETARQLLSAPSPDAELDRLYPLLVRHHVAPAILETLRCAGGELAELSVASGLVASLRPFNRLLPELPFNRLLPERIPLSELALGIQRHATHLEAVVQGLSDRRLAERFVLLFGAALRLVAPSYPRLSNDLDLYTPSAAGGVELVRELRDRWGFVLVRKRTWPFHGRELAHFRLLRTTDDGHQLHVDVIAGGRPARPGLTPAFVEPQLFERSRMMTLDGRRVRVPSTEDMLVWLAEKVVRRGHLGLRDVHDAWVLASNESGGTDWSRVLKASARHGLIGILSRLLAVAEQVNGQIAIEPDVRRILKRDRRQWTAGAYPQAKLASRPARRGSRPPAPAGRSGPPAADAGHETTVQPEDLVVSETHEEFPVPDEHRLKELVARIPAERCSVPGCNQAAAAVTQRRERYVFLCVSHAERAAPAGPVFQPGGDGVGVEQFAVDPDIHSRWEAKWSADTYAPEWRIRSIPQEIQQAVDEEWFPSGASLLDIGCGSGEIAAWLARQGYDVLGIDFAPSAIAKARDVHADIGGVTFDVVDICLEAPPGGPFDALVDRGCLHGIPSEERPAYLWHVAPAAKPGAPFLLLHRILEDFTEEDQRRDLEAVLGEEFEIVRVADTVMASIHATGDKIPGLALWMIRR